MSEAHIVSMGNLLERAAKSLLAIAVVIALGIATRAFVIDLYRVPSESMAPTLLPGDWIIVERLRFGPYFPFTHQRLGKPKLPALNAVVLLATDQVVVSQSGRGAILVKRVVGRAGDTLQMKHGVLFINGSGHELQRLRTGRRSSDLTTPLLDWMRKYSTAQARLPAQAETLTLDNWGPILVPRDSLFVLGDNRHRSMDSRQFGFVPSTAVVGAVRYIYFSVHQEPGAMLPRFMLDRIGPVN